MAKSNGGSRSPKETGSTHCLKGATQLGGQPLGSVNNVEDYDLVGMKNSSKNKFFRGSGGSPSMDNASSSIGGKVKS